MNLDYLASIDLLFYIIFGLGILMGLIRGMKKTLFTFVTMAIFYIIFFVTIDSVVSFLWKMDMSWLGTYLSQISPDLAGFTSFENSFGTVVQVVLGNSVDLSTMDAQVMVLVSGIGMFVLKLVYTLLYFTVILLLYKILCGIIRLIFFGKNDKNASKNPGFGALFGALNGAMAVFITLIMLGGVVSIVESASTVLEMGQQPTQVAFPNREELYQAEYTLITPQELAAVDLSQQIDLLNQLVTNYHNNIFVKLSDQITVNVAGTDQQVPLNLSLFDKVLSFKLDDQDIAIRYELSVFSEVLSVFLNSDFSTTQNISDISGNDIRQAFTILSNSKLITSLLPIAIEVGSASFDVQLDISTADLYAIDYQSELENLGSVAGTLFDIINGAGIISGDGGVDNIEVDGTIIRGIFSDLSNSNLMVLVASSLLIPVIENPDSNISLFITVPEDLDWQQEFVAIGDVLAEVWDSGVTINELANGDANVLMNAVSNIDLTVLMSSKIISNAMINILSGQAPIEGLSDFLVVPDGVIWEDTLDVDGNIVQNGELRNILLAINALTGAVANFDINQFGLSTISELEDSVIDTLFDSRVLVATVSSLLTTQDLGGELLVVPDSVYDDQGFLLKSELKALAKSIKLLVGSLDTESPFDIQKVLNLSDTDLNTLLGSQIVEATVGNLIYGMNSDPLVIPSDALTSVVVNSESVTIVSSLEIKSIIQSLQVLGLSNFDSMSFDAGILSSLELIPEVGEPTTLDDAKITTLLTSKIIHATISKMIIDLGQSSSDLLVIPEKDVNGNDVISTVLSTNYLSISEIGALLKALYSIDITNFDNIDFGNTSLILDHSDVLLDSAIIHATISNQILSISDSFIAIPYEDELTNPIITTVGDTTYISTDELNAFLDALSLLGVTDPNAFTNAFTLTTFASDSDQNRLLDSSIMQATISKTLFDLGSTLLIIPLTEEDGVTDVRVTTGPAGHQTEFIVKNEIKAIINGLLAMDFSNLSSFGSTFNSSSLFDHSVTLLLSSSFQATISNQLLTVTSGTLVIPDQDGFGNDIRIPLSDVTYVSKTEIQNIIDALVLLNMTDLTSFDLSPSAIFNVDFNQLLASATMQATVSYYVLENSNDETAAQMDISLIVPTAVREAITVDGSASSQIQKDELILLLSSLQMMNIEDFSGGVDAGFITDMTEEDLSTLLDSASMHITLHHMINANTNINTSVPALAKATSYGIANVTTKQEIIAFILAANLLTSGDFTSAAVDFNYIVANLTPAQQGIVFNSMTVRNIVTPNVELICSNILNPYPLVAADYDDDPVQDFLTKATILSVIDYYGLS